MPVAGFLFFVSLMAVLLHKSEPQTYSESFKNYWRYIPLAVITFPIFIIVFGIIGMIALIIMMILFSPFYMILAIETVTWLSIPIVIGFCTGWAYANAYGFYRIIKPLTDMKFTFNELKERDFYRILLRGSFYGTLIILIAALLGHIMMINQGTLLSYFLWVPVALIFISVLPFYFMIKSEYLKSNDSAFWPIKDELQQKHL